MTVNFYVESLTRRELDVLRLLGENLSDREIADRLTLALSSVKWYTRQVYAKLGVENRRQAVSKARELGWFDSRRSSSPPVHNLPRQLTRLIGRVKEISQVVEMVWEHPLVTLAGSGGVGKTCLALAVAHELLDDFPDGVRYVELASLSDPQHVLREVMNVIGLHEEPGRTFLETLVYYFSERQAMLILDNAEHLVDASAELANSLLRSAPGLKILATSREPLGVNGEAVYRVPSLPFPSAGPAVPLEDLLQYESVQLFLDRAQAVLPDFQVSGQNVAQVVQICRRLDGIPLAIELAASRSASLDVGEIAERLEHDFRMLSGSRTALERQRTLRTTIDWSYNLLSDAEKLLLRRLGIFMGGWTLEAAENTCAGEGIEKEDVLDLLSQLVNKSMVLAQIRPGKETRYRMLETIHQYAFDELVRSGESEELRRRHCAWFMELAETAEAKLVSREHPAWVVKLKAEHDNLQAALEWSLGEGADPVAGLRGLNAITYQYWIPWGDPVQSYHWLEKGLAAISIDKQPSPILQVRTLGCMAGCSGSIDWRLITPLLEKGLELCRNLGEEARLEHARLLDSLGWHLSFDLGQLEEGLKVLDEADPLLRGLGPECAMELACNLSSKSWVFRVQSDDVREEACVEEQSEVCLPLGLEWCGVHKPIGDLALRKGDFALANQHYEADLAICHAAGDEEAVADDLRKLGEVAKAQGLYEKANSFYRESLKIIYDHGNAAYINWLFACLGMNQISMAQNQTPAEAYSSLLWAARILGADQALVDELGLPMPVPVEIQQGYEQAVASLKESIDPASFEAAWEEGRKMKLKQAVSYALG